MAGHEDERRGEGAPSHPLQQLQGLRPEAISSLRSRWIETVEQLLSVAATETGRQGLRELLQLDDGELNALLSRASALVGPESIERLSQAKAGGPLGVPITDEQKEELRREREERSGGNGA